MTEHRTPTLGLKMATLGLLLALPISAALAHESSRVDISHLPVGDGKLSDGPKVGYIWACHTDPQAGGAQAEGPWFSGDGTYNFNAKAIVDGQVTWPNKYTMHLNGDSRVFTTNDLPNHPTGTFPVARNDDAYLYDRNPNSIRAQDLSVTLRTTPQLAAQATCAPGAVGILISGSVLFNALDAPGRDAVAHETQDGCQGHPQESGVYHYHSITTCIPDERSANGHSKLVGYALDGFGIYGRFDMNGKELASADLDACHGHTGLVEWDGKMVVMYHYHATWDFPYTVGCMRGTYSNKDVQTVSGPPPSHRGGPGQMQGGQMQGGQMQGGMMPGRQMQGGQMQGGQMQGGMMPGGPRQGGGPPDLNAAAAKLGIDPMRLHEALGPPPPDLRAAASKLGISEAALREALGRR
jgi:hypothetical protein